MSINAITQDPLVKHILNCVIQDATQVWLNIDDQNYISLTFINSFYDYNNYEASKWIDLVWSILPHNPETLLWGYSIPTHMPPCKTDKFSNAYEWVKSCEIRCSGQRAFPAPHVAAVTIHLITLNQLYVTVGEQTLQHMWVGAAVQR